MGRFGHFGQDQWTILLHGPFGILSQKKRVNFEMV